MSPAKTAAQRQAERKAREIAAGRVQWKRWVHPDDVPALSEYADKLTRSEAAVNRNRLRMQRQGATMNATNETTLTEGLVPQRVRPLRWMCQSCDWIGNDGELLRAPNPFDAGDTICGCPKCKAVNEIVNACDEPGCKREAGCGFPTDDGGYRRTCYLHSKWADMWPNAKLTGPSAGHGDTNEHH